MNAVTLQDILAEAEMTVRPLAFSIRKIDRRTFLKLTGIAGGGLMLGFSLRSEANPVPPAEANEFVPNGFVRIAADGRITLYSKNPEVGQGIKTALPMIVAEELDAYWDDVQVAQAPIDESYYGRQSAGGSQSIPTGWDIARRAGAVARAMLVEAAAQQWQVSASECTTAASHVMHAASRRTVAYRDLANAAAKLPVPDPESIALKQRQDYKLLGKRVSGVDNHLIVTGQPLFGIDTVLPNMLYAAYEKCPATGGKPVSFNVDQIKSLPGVVDAFIIEGNDNVTELMPGVAIIAKSTWAAFSAKKQLKVKWDESNASKDSWSAATDKAQQIAKKPLGEETLADSGNVDEAWQQAGATHTAYYSYPFIPHAPLEPQNCTAWVHDGHAEVWAPSQRPQQGVTSVAKVLGLPEEQVLVHQLRIGGGFGRRLMNDFMCEAAAIAQRTNAPVKLMWTREDDMLHDFYRVGGFHSFRGAVDKTGKLSVWDDHFITFKDDANKPVSGGNISEQEFPLLLVPNSRLTQTMMPLKVPTGPWRAPRSNSIAFAVQSFIDEMAKAANRDHLEFLLDIMGEPRWLKDGDANALNTGRAAGVIRLAAEKASWGKPLPEGHGMGLAFHFSHAGHVAEVAEVSVVDKKLTIHQITVAADVGPIINLSGAENQAQGAVIDGLSTALGLGLTIEKGRIQETNFHQYPILRMKQSPRVTVHFIESDFSPTGLGEPALPPAAPAICNAIFAACGIRIRELPLSKHGFTV